ncbi:MAG: L,D-transpeptidase [Pseudonocardiaceae bacterium]
MRVVVSGWGNRAGGRPRWASVVLALTTTVIAGVGLVMVIWSVGPAVGWAGTNPAAPLLGSAARITPGPDQAINPTTPIVVQATGGRLQSVAVTNTASGVQVSGALSPDAMTWRSTEPLGYASTYRVDVTAPGLAGLPEQQSSTVHTLTPAAQAYPSLIPAPGQADVGVGQPIVVRFDQPISDRAAAEKALQVHSTPNQPGSWFWMSSTEVHYRPPAYWQPGSTVTLDAKLYGVDLGNGVYGQTDRTLTFHVHDAWLAKADGKTEQLQIFHNGAPVKTMPMSLGAPGYPTHSGPHVISDKQPSIIMDSCTYGVCQGQPGYYREQVNLDERISNDGEFVHSAPWSVSHQGSSNVSHGCVNLSPANAQWFYDHFGLGDVVEVTNSGGPPLPVWDTYGDWELSWSQWQAGSALHP